MEKERLNYKVNCIIPKKIKEAIYNLAKSKGYSNAGVFISKMFGLYLTQPADFVLKPDDIIRYNKMEKVRYSWRLAKEHEKDFEYLAEINIRSLAGQSEYILFAIYKNYCEK